MRINSKIYIAGHNGMVGSAIWRRLKKEGFKNLMGRTSAELDLTNQLSTDSFFKANKPEFVFLAAAKVGGIHANNTHRADFIYDNLMIEANVIHSAYTHGVKNLLFLGSSCIYPKMAAQPLKEEYLLNGPLEPTNEPYAIAKIAGIKLCQAYRAQHNCNFISVIPTNLYGIGDNYDLDSSHVLPALIHKFHKAKAEKASSVTLWGTGSAMREFLYADDLADACLMLMKNYDDPEPINVGAGKDLTICELANRVKKLVGFEGTVHWDASKPDGTPKKLLDLSRINRLGWSAKTGLDEGLVKSYQDFQKRYNQ